MQVVHRVVLFLNARAAFSGSRDMQRLLRGMAQFDCDSSHFGEVAVHLFRQGVMRVATPGDLRDVQGQRAHPVDVGSILDRGDDGPQLTGHRRLQRQQRERGLLGVRAHPD